MKIKSITKAGVEPVYNMTVDEHHNYMIHGGLILKNCDSLRYFCIMRQAVPKEPDTRTEQHKRIEADFQRAVFGTKNKRKSRF